MSANNPAAAELFGLLSAFWQPPDELFWNNLADGSVDAELANFSQLAGFPPVSTPPVLFQQTLPKLDALKLFYLRCFIGIGKQSALPVESIYKKWTEDSTVRLPIAGSTGYLMGDPALHAQYLLDHYELQVPPDYRMMPDHLLLLLELLSFMLENRPIAETDLFLRQHFDWLDSFSEALEAIDIENPEDLLAKRFYQLALFCLKQSIQCQLAKYDQVH
jgi:TorA maturation chaperone TorD